MGYRIIVNADDFGLNTEVNEAIFSSLRRGLCSSTTIMANMDGFYHAAGLVRDNHIDKCLGIHLNLTEGYPLTEKIKSNTKLCDVNGMLNYNNIFKGKYYLSGDSKRMIYEELNAQIDLCRREGISITHADSHSHVHENPELISLIMSLLKSKGINHIRIAANIGTPSTYIKIVYRRMLNIFIKNSGMPFSDYFGSVNDFDTVDKNYFKDNSLIELMVHPGKILDDRIIDVYSGKCLNEQIKSISKYGDVMSLIN